MIQQFDAKKDNEKLKAHNIHLRNECIEYMKLSEIIIKEAMKKGLNLALISELLDSSHPLKPKQTDNETVELVNKWIGSKFLCIIGKNILMRYSRHKIKEEHLSEYYKLVQLSSDVETITKRILGFEIFQELLAEKKVESTTPSPKPQRH